MSKFYILFLSLSVLFLNSCFNRNNIVEQNVDISSALQESEGDLRGFSPEVQNLIKNRCIQNTFAQGQDENLYGIDCIEGKHLFVETVEPATPVSTTYSAGGLRLENEENCSLKDTSDEAAQECAFANKIYDSKYNVLEEGSDRQIPFLRNFLSKNERFLGALNKKYRIIFEIHGNYLILFKASEDLNDLPYTERTSLMKSKDGRFHMVPFIGYPIEYCYAEPIRNAHGEETYENKRVCHAQKQNAAGEVKYIHVQQHGKQAYRYLEKKDLFPSDYFDGQWFYSSGAIEASNNQGEWSPSNAYLVRMKKKSGQLDIVDDSGDIESRNRVIHNSIPIHWREYEPARNGELFETFGERLYEGQQSIGRPYLTVDFSGIKVKLQAKHVQNISITDLLITKDYFSFVIDGTTSEVDELGESVSKPVKIKTSFLRKDVVDTEGFTPRKWFLDDDYTVFGVLPAAPQDEMQAGEGKRDDVFDHFRMIRFNTSLNTEKEKKEKTKIITWHFSKNSTKDEVLRALARKAVHVWNRAFEIITENSDQKVKVVLDETDEKDLGDLRYNVINLVKLKDQVGRGGLLGYAPSYMNPDTGQIIGTTTNLFAHTILNTHYQYVRSYIRYEIFQKNHKGVQNESHVLTPYVRSEIETQCPEVTDFIRKSKKNVRRRDNLDDRELVLSCGEQISKDDILAVILHEMGHSFGLAHNFRASTDKDNYYQSADEVKSNFPDSDGVTAKTSSVMDYIFGDNPRLTVLGKYDLEALRFLYLNQVTAKNGSILDLNIPEDLSKQKRISSTVLLEKKPYLHCSDYYLRTGQDSLCQDFDYGSTPEEVVRNSIDRFRYAMNSRYRYDSLGINMTYPMDGVLGQAIILYRKWLRVRDEYLSSANQLDSLRYIMGDKQSIERYNNILEDGLKSSEEYRSFYEIRDLMFQFLLDEALFLETMKCKVKDRATGQIYFLNLESIKDKIAIHYGDELYVEDCYSEQIKDFIENNELELLEQKGIEVFFSYYRRGSQSQVADVLPITELDNLFGYLRRAGLDLSVFTHEPDFFEKFKDRMENALLNGTGKFGYDYVRYFHILFPMFISNLQLNNQQDQSLLLKNNGSLHSVAFTIGTGAQSFYKKVLEPIRNDLNVESIGIPFLKDQYEAYNKMETGQFKESFENYLKRLDVTTTAVHNNTNYLIMPFQSGNFAEKIIRKYNENLRLIEELNHEVALTSTVGQIRRDGLENHNLFLLDILFHRDMRHSDSARSSMGVIQ